MSLLVSPYPSELAHLKLEVENIDQSECLGTIEIVLSVGNLSKLNDHYRIQAVPQDGYVFDHWEVNLKIETTAGEVVKDLGSDFVEKVEGRDNYAFSNPFVQEPYTPNESAIVVNFVATPLDAHQVLSYTTLAKFKKG